MTVRVLTADDWTSMSRLRVTRKTHAGAPVSKFASNPIVGVANRYQVAPNLAVGKFNEAGRLEAFVCCGSDQDFWVLDLMVSDGDPTSLHDCLEMCLQHYESAGVFQFYYAFPQKWARAYRSFWKSGVPSLRKYTIEDISVIPANRVPTDPFVWNHVLHEFVPPVPFLLRRSYATVS